MSKVGLPTPKNFLIHEASEVDAAGKHVGFPAVIKPIHGAASLGVVRVENFDDLHSVRRTTQTGRGR
jgi:carnosine synthase